MPLLASQTGSDTSHTGVGIGVACQLVHLIWGLPWNRSSICVGHWQETGFPVAVYPGTLTLADLSPSLHFSAEATEAKIKKPTHALACNCSSFYVTSESHIRTLHLRTLDCIWCQRNFNWNGLSFNGVAVWRHSLALQIAFGGDTAAFVSDSAVWCGAFEKKQSNSIWPSHANSSFCLDMWLFKSRTCVWC